MDKNKKKVISYEAYKCRLRMGRMDWGVGGVCKEQLMNIY